MSDLVVAPIRSPRRSGGFRGVLVVGFAVVVAIGSVRSWPMVTDAFSHMAALGPRTVVLLASVWLLLAASRGLVYRSTHRDLSIRHGVVLDQVHLAANNALPGGSLIGIAARFRILRGLGLSAEASALSVAASGQAFALGRWVVAVLIAFRFLMVGRASSADVVVLASAMAAFAVSFVMLRVVTGDGRVSRSVLSLVRAAHRRVALRSIRVRRMQIDESVAKLRRGAGRIVRERGPLLLAAGAMSTLASALVVVVLTRELTNGMGPATWDVLRAYLFARVATSFVPTPGNVGVLDGALAAGLVATGLDPASALAVVLLYRAVTFVVPMIVGGALWLFWRRRVSAIGSQTVVEANQTDDDSMGRPIPAAA